MHKYEIEAVDERPDGPLWVKPFEEFTDIAEILKTWGFEKDNRGWWWQTAKGFEALSNEEQSTENIILSDFEVSSNEKQAAENIFSGKFSVNECLERIRKRLLDLSKRNKLLNFHDLTKETKPSARLLRIINAAPEKIFQKIYTDNESIKILPIPEPRRDTWPVDEQEVANKPDVRTHAHACGIDTNYDLCGTGGSDIQTLIYAEDLEAKLRKIGQASRTAIEETGTNVLYLAFGFLQWYESIDSDIPLFAPLIALPVTIKKE
jgi:hypothetical protein